MPVKELLFSPFSEQSLFRSSYFFIRIASFQSEISIEQPLLDNKNFFKAVAFKNSYFFPCLR